jgi:hypothetical protein
VAWQVWQALAWVQVKAQLAGYAGGVQQVQFGTFRITKGARSAGQDLTGQTVGVASVVCRRRSELSIEAVYTVAAAVAEFAKRVRGLACENPGNHHVAFEVALRKTSAGDQLTILASRA